MTFSEHRYWSVFHNTRVARLSMADAWGGEHFAIIPTDRMRADEPKRSWRERRDEALEAIAEHIGAGAPAGEVSVAA